MSATHSGITIVQKIQDAIQRATKPSSESENDQLIALFKSIGTITIGRDKQHAIIQQLIGAIKSLANQLSNGFSQPLFHQLLLLLSILKEFAPDYSEKLKAMMPVLMAAFMNYVNQCASVSELDQFQTMLATICPSLCAHYFQPLLSTIENRIIQLQKKPVSLTQPSRIPETLVNRTPYTRPIVTQIEKPNDMNAVLWSLSYTALPHVFLGYFNDELKKISRPTSHQHPITKISS